MYNPRLHTHQPNSTEGAKALCACLLGSSPFLAIEPIVLFVLSAASLAPCNFQSSNTSLCFGSYSIFNAPGGQSRSACVAAAIFNCNRSIRGCVAIVGSNPQGSLQRIDASKGCFPMQWRTVQYLRRYASITALAFKWHVLVVVEPTGIFTVNISIMNCSSNKHARTDDDTGALQQRLPNH